MRLDLQIQQGKQLGLLEVVILITTFFFSNFLYNC